MRNPIQRLFSRAVRIIRSFRNNSNYDTDIPENMLPRLSALDGSTLRHAFSFYSHCISGLIAVEQPRGSAEIFFHGTQFTNIPDEVHEASFHRITLQDVQAIDAINEIKRTKNISNINYKNTMLIKCREGEFYISTYTVTYPVHSKNFPRGVEGFYGTTDHYQQSPREA